MYKYIKQRKCESVCVCVCLCVCLCVGLSVCRSVGLWLWLWLSICISVCSVCLCLRVLTVRGSAYDVGTTLDNTFDTSTLSHECEDKCIHN